MTAERQRGPALGVERGAPVSAIHQLEPGYT